MTMIKKSITVTDQQNKWLQSQIRSGRYASDSEILRELIREKQEATMNTLRVEAIRSMLVEGESSGVTTSNPDDIKQRVLVRRKKMHNYQLTTAAEKDLEGILEFGLDTFGEGAAIDYYDKLVDQFTNISENPLRYPSRAEIREHYRVRSF